MGVFFTLFNKKISFRLDFIRDYVTFFTPKLEDVILRIYWDGARTPAVETPLGDFFCNGFGERYDVNSLPIVVNPNGGMNSYFEMPFRKKAKITITTHISHVLNKIHFNF
ncbi:DUF2961 domain-containing protein [Heyndrickxia coagulans]|uniref:DUF2961 domain-containing protein n=1 Tax=Heyndrickxia coagulans TaxID=1398 RepID=UPI000792B2DB|nr:DUF2961 domain-containing protein [Heyndrickxia coagulans]KYC61268.1 hypothetical protein B4100_3889 [Heyndrickxia coagulans]